MWVSQTDKKSQRKNKLRHTGCTCVIISCRSAPLSLSLFGEHSATSFADEPPAALEAGPLWTPAWLPTSSPLQTQHAQHAQQLQHDQQPQHAQRAHSASDGQHQQQPHQSQPAAIPNMLVSQPALPDTEDDSDFGSFTGIQTIWGPPSSQVESAQDCIAKPDWQAPLHFQRVMSSAANDGTDSSGAADKPPLRPAAAAGTASFPQSMDRSAPISMGLFGEESYDDPVLGLPAQAAVQGAAVDLQQEAISASPLQMPSASRGHEDTNSEQAASGQQAHTPQHESRPRHTFPPQVAFQAEHDFEPSWQHARTTNQPVKSALIITPDAADDDFSPSWQQADGKEDFGAEWQNKTASGSFWTTATASQSPHAFAATWPPLITDADSASRQRLSGRQALSGPISSELFGMEEQEDQPLGLPTEAPIKTLSAPQSPDAAVDDGQQQFGDTVHPQQPAAASQSETTQQSVLGDQTPSGPISLELFGMEETQDAPLELPVQATITVLPTPAPDTSLSLPTGTSSQFKQFHWYTCMWLCTCLSLLHHASIWFDAAIGRLAIGQ